MIDISLTDLRAGLSASLAVDRFVDDVVRHAPFDSVARLLEIAREVAFSLSASEISQAIAQHPRIGEQPTGAGVAQDFSRQEQAGFTDAIFGDALSGHREADLTAAIAAGNSAYEERFGRVFIIRAAGRSRAEILEELERRLELPNSTELEIVGEQLLQIAVLRIEKLWGDEVADVAAGGRDVAAGASHADSDSQWPESAL